MLLSSVKSQRQFAIAIMGPEISLENYKYWR